MALGTASDLWDPEEPSNTFGPACQLDMSIAPQPLPDRCLQEAMRRPLRRCPRLRGQREDVHLPESLPDSCLHSDAPTIASSGPAHARRREDVHLPAAIAGQVSAKGDAQTVESLRALLPCGNEQMSISPQPLPDRCLRRAMRRPLHR